MEIPELARVAGESFSMITGVDLAYDDLETDAPEGFQAGPNDNPGRRERRPGPGRGPALARPRADPATGGRTTAPALPPAPATCSAARFDEAACQHALAAGFQRQRRAAAFELALARPEAPLFNWRQPARAQQRFVKPPPETAAVAGAG